MAFIARIFTAVLHGINGLQLTFKNEWAFRIEVFVFFAAVVCALIISESTIEFVLLTFASGVVLVAELLNTAIEKVSDRVSQEFDELGKFAKDAGAAAVLCAILLACGVWGVVLGEKLLW